jgi:TPR repeat protein
LSQDGLEAPGLAEVLLATLAAMTPAQRARTLGDDPCRAALWIRAAAEQGVGEGQVSYGRLLLEGRGAPADATQALEWFRKAAAQDCVDAWNMVGRCLENGWGCAPDLAEAARWYDRAARAEHAWAQYNLGHLYLNGQGVTRDAARAFRLYRRAAEQGHVRAMSLVGRCHEQGWGVGADLAPARDWYEASAEGGYFRGQYNFGLILAEEGSLAEAGAWLERALACAPEPSRSVMAKALASWPEPALAAIGIDASTPPNTVHQALCLGSIERRGLEVCAGGPTGALRPSLELNGSQAQGLGDELRGLVDGDLLTSPCRSASVSQ